MIKLFSTAVDRYLRKNPVFENIIYICIYISIFRHWNLLTALRFKKNKDDSISLTQIIKESVCKFLFCHYVIMSFSYFRVVSIISRWQSSYLYILIQLPFNKSFILQLYKCIWRRVMKYVQLIIGGYINRLDKFYLSRPYNVLKLRLQCPYVMITVSLVSLIYKKKTCYFCGHELFFYFIVLASASIRLPTEILPVKLYYDHYSAKSMDSWKQPIINDKTLDA